VQFASLPILPSVWKVKGGAKAGFPGLDELFEGRHFNCEIVVLCVRWYLRFNLSFRDLVEMMAERGLSMAHTTIMRGCIIMFLSSNTTGTGSQGRSALRGVSTKPT
jgi:hypothetical protein